MRDGLMGHAEPGFLTAPLWRLACAILALLVGGSFFLGLLLPAYAHVLWQWRLGAFLPLLILSLGVPRFIRWCDALSQALGWLAAVALLLACLLSARAAVLRYAFSLGSNAWLEAQWYLFGLAIFAGAPMLLRLNEHVRVDVLYGGRSPRAKAWIDLLGVAFVLLPLCGITAWLAWPFAVQAYVQQEVSPSAGGLLRWPIKLAIPLGFMLLALQGVAELFKRIAFLRGESGVDTHYERPLQ